MANRTTKDAMVFKTEKGWAIQKSDKEKASRVYDSKRDAESFAREQREKGYDVIIFRKDGGLDKYLPKKK